MAINTRQNLYFYGSALSPDRCLHYVKLFNFASEHFSDVYTYSTLRDEAEKKKVLTNDAIRTFIPIFKGLGFVDYERKGIFSFLDYGKLFYHIQTSIYASEKLPDGKREQIISLLENAKLKLIWKGLIHLYRLDDDNSRKFQIVLRLLEKFGEVSVQEYLYAIYYSLENSTTDFEAITNSIQDRRERGIQDEVYSWNSRANNYEPTKDTATSYLKDLLRAANLLKDIDSGKITASDQFSSFMSMINQ